MFVKSKFSFHEFSLSNDRISLRNNSKKIGNRLARFLSYITHAHTHNIRSVVVFLFFCNALANSICLSDANHFFFLILFTCSDHCSYHQWFRAEENTNTSCLYYSFSSNMPFESLLRRCSLSLYQSMTLEGKKKEESTDNHDDIVEIYTEKGKG